MSPHLPHNSLTSLNSILAINLLATPVALATTSLAETSSCPLGYTATRGIVRMPLNEADTRAKLIDPSLHSRGWTEDFIRREETKGAIEIVNGVPRRVTGRTDYTLREL